MTQQFAESADDMTGSAGQQDGTALVLSVSDFVAVLNQTLEYAYPSVTIQGELANFRISKNKWVYFDLKDDFSSVKFFGTVYQLPGPLEDGLMMQVKGTPRLHQLYGFSVNVQFMQPVGEGSIQKAAALLEAKLAAEGLFDPERKRPLPYPPANIGLVTSSESAAYHDFVKILNARWGGLNIELADVQVQGEAAISQIVAAIEYFNQHADPPELLVITRGGGSADDLAAFSTEQVTRAVAGSRIPTIVAIGHEVDISLAELAADQRASTPSNAAELLVPDKKHVREQLNNQKLALGNLLQQWVKDARQLLKNTLAELQKANEQFFSDLRQSLGLRRQLLEALSPEAALKRGYAIIRGDKGIIRSVKQIKPGQKIDISVQDGDFKAEVQ